MIDTATRKEMRRDSLKRGKSFQLWLVRALARVVSRVLTRVIRMVLIRVTRRALARVIKNGSDKGFDKRAKKNSDKGFELHEGTPCKYSAKHLLCIIAG